MFFVYILYSNTIDKFYIGQTDDIERRVHDHNHEDNLNWTSKGKPWMLKKSIECPSRLVAVRIERVIKNKKSREYLKALIDKPELAEILLRAHDC